MNILLMEANLAGIGAHSYTAGNTGGSEEVVQFKK